ncbi:hypothetical protein HQ487_04495 [Candidatus Uhrbacteria bacterium]|nr:hypothetical protein [Candidatus Uhrbacteria bacterium]
MTLEQTIVHQIQKAFVAWVDAGRPGLFRRYLEKQEEGILDILEMQPGFRKKLGRKILKELDKEPPRKRLHHSALALFMNEIANIYQQGHIPGTFESFLERLCKECQDTEELEVYLKTFKD